MFDSNPALTNGYAGSDDCSILTPMYLLGGNTSVSTISTYNHTAEQYDQYYSISSFPIDLDLSGDIYNMYTYAVWSDPTPVPLPAAFWLFGFGLLGLLGLRGRIR